MTIPAYTWDKTLISEYANFGAWVTAQGSNNVSLMINKDVTLDANVTIPSNISIIGFNNGAKFNGSFTITFDNTEKTINCDPHTQIFGSGVSVSGLRRARPEWFGTGSGADEVAIHKCISGIYAISGDNYNGSPYRIGTIELLPKTYTFSGTLNWYDSVYGLQINLYGNGAQFLAGSGSTAFKIGQDNIWLSKPVFNSEICGFDLRCNSNTKTGIKLTGKSITQNEIHSIQVQTSGTLAGTKGDNTQGICLTAINNGVYYNSIHDIYIYGFDKNISIGFDWSEVSQKTISNVNTGTDIITTSTAHEFNIGDEVYVWGDYLKKKQVTAVFSGNMFTCNNTTNIIAENDIVQFISAGTPPAEISASTGKWYQAVNVTVSGLQVQEIGGSLVTFTDNGAGNLYVKKAYVPAGIKKMHKYYVKSTPTTSGIILASGASSGTTIDILHSGAGSLYISKYACSRVTASGNWSGESGFDDPDPNANRFFNVNVYGHKTYGLFVAESYGHTFQNFDFTNATQGSTSGAEYDIYYAQPAGDALIESRNESGAEMAFFEAACDSVRFFPMIVSDPVQTDSARIVTTYGRGILRMGTTQTNSITPSYLNSIYLQSKNRYSAYITDEGFQLQNRLIEDAISFNANDTSPSVSGGNFFKTASGNTSKITLSGFDDGIEGQKITIFAVTPNDLRFISQINPTAAVVTQGVWEGAANRNITLQYDGTRWVETGRNDRLGVLIGRYSNNSTSFVRVSPEYGFNIGGGYFTGAGNLHVDSSSDFVSGAIEMISISGSGNGYSRGDEITITGGDGTASGYIEEIGGTGNATSVVLTSLGSGYVTSGNVATAGGGGTGFTLNIERIKNLAAITSSGGIFANKSIRSLTSGVFASGVVVGTNKVVGTRDTGWSGISGTPVKGGITTSGVSLSGLAEVVMAMYNTLSGHGLLGA